MTPAALTDTAEQNALCSKLQSTHSPHQSICIPRMLQVPPVASNAQGRPSPSQPPRPLELCQAICHSSLRLFFPAPVEPGL